MCTASPYYILVINNNKTNIAFAKAHNITH